MPDVHRNGSMEIDLKLHGDKIKLESRPASRESASRPVSALTLYNTPKEEHTGRRRPHSADDNKELLPSSELLKSLVSQPIVSWRNGSAELSPNYKSDDDVLNAPCQLTPGLTGKPPLPMIKREKKLGKDGNGEKEDFDEEGSSYAKELEEIASRLSEIETNAITPDLIADNQVQYQNWITDRMVEDAEKRTDLILSKIYQQQNELIEEPTLQNEIQRVNNEYNNTSELIQRNKSPLIQKENTNDDFINKSRGIQIEANENGFKNKSQLIQRQHNDIINKSELTHHHNQPKLNLNNKQSNEMNKSKSNYKCNQSKLNLTLEQETNLIYDSKLCHSNLNEKTYSHHPLGSSYKNRELKFNSDKEEKGHLNHKSRVNQKGNELKFNPIQEKETYSIVKSVVNSKNRQTKLNSPHEENSFYCQSTELNHKNVNFDEDDASLIQESKLNHSKNNFDDLELKISQSQMNQSAVEKKSPTSISFEKFFSEIPPIDLPSEKIITLSERPVEKPTKAKNVVAANRKPRMGVKFSPKSFEKKVEPAKGKFTAKTMRSGKDCVEKTGVLDEEISWMSRPEKTEIVEEENLSIAKKREEIVTAENEMRIDDDDDEIAAILEVLEAESQKSQSKIQSMKKIVSTELNATINSIRPPVQRKDDFVEDTSTSSESSYRLNHVQEAINCGSKIELKGNTSNSSITSNNYKEILSFLDEVDKNSTQSLNTAKDRIAVATKLIDGSINLDSVPRLEDLLAHTPTQLANEVVDLNLRLKEKSSAIRTLQEELSSLREHVIKSTKQTERIVKDKLRAQKEEADAIVRRHQKFIDQLIGEKKGLGQQCENLVGEMRMMEERFVANAKAAEHRHQVEMQKMKDMHIAGEKMRRERWLDSKTQKIKEMTVKSIEPEIQSMTVRHEQELADLRSLHKREIEDIELKNARKMQQQCEAIRAQMTEEREKALAHEREVMRHRYESMVESEEKSYQDQRKRLMQEHAHRMEECESREEAAIAEKERALKQLQDEYEDKIQSIVRRHANEVKISRESADLEMETWRNNCRKQLEMQLAAKEASLREQLRKERDREIELVIERLESESNEARAQLEAASENRIRRLRDKYEKEIKDLELSENEAKVKYAEMKGRLLENEELVIGLKASNKNFENQLREAQQLCEKLESERQSMKESLEQEIKEEISSLEKEIERIKDDRDAELQQVYSRVKVAVARKDETISELSRENASLKEKCKYLESMLEQQRKEYLIK